MSEVSISILSDPDARHTGEAILRLTGVALLPPGSTYRIDPVSEDEAAVPPEGWPSGELKPREQRITRDGVDLIIGAEVVEATALLPGTPVTVSVPAVGARAELLWPSLRDANTSPAEDADARDGEEASELAIRAAVKLATQMRTDLEPIEIELAPSAGSDAEEAERKIIAALARNLVDDGALSSLSLSPDVPNRPRPAPQLANDEALATLKPVTRPPATREAPPPVPPKPVPPHVVTPPTPAVLEAVPPPPPKPTTRRPMPAGAFVEESSARSGASRPWGPIIAAFGLGLAIAGGAAAMLPNLAPRGASHSAPVTARTESAQRPTPLPTMRLAEILAVPDSSPHGVAADNFGLEDALRRADRSLSKADGTAPDRREAKFWLRKALSAGLGDERLLWAMTQLGTIYASPEGEAPDFASARILWELASAKGDPVALCFLASLFEGGLGVAKDTTQALSLYQRAKANGGCRGIDDAIARLTKGAP